MLGVHQTEDDWAASADVAKIATRSRASIIATLRSKAKVKTQIDVHVKLVDRDTRPLIDSLVIYVRPSLRFMCDKEEDTEGWVAEITVLREAGAQRNATLLFILTPPTIAALHYCRLLQLLR